MATYFVLRYDLAFSLACIDTPARVQSMARKQSLLARFLPIQHTLLTTCIRANYSTCLVLLFMYELHAQEVVEW